NIIAGCKRGEHASQCEAYRRSWRQIYPAVYHILRNREEAEDLVQESLVKGFSRLNELKDDEKYVPWQKQIALRAALNHVKRKIHFLTLTDEEDELETD